VPRSAEAVAVLKLELSCTSKELTFAELATSSLRFYLHGQPQHVYELYQLLFRDVLNIAVASSPDDSRPTVLGKQAIEPVGFERSEGLLLRSLSDFYKTFSQTIPEPAKTEALLEVEAHFRALIGRVDASLVEEWESLANPQARERSDPSGTTPVVADLLAVRVPFIVP